MKNIVDNKGFYSIRDDLDSSNLVITSSVVITGSLIVTGSTNISGSTILNGPLTVTGQTNLSGGLSLTDLEITNRLVVTGSAIVTGSFFVTGSTNLTGSLTIDNITGKQYPFKDLWDDLLGSISDGNLGKGSAALTSEEYRDTGFLMFFLRHNQDDTINIVYQMPHMWDATTAVRPHMHIVPMAAAAGNIYVEYAYSWAPFDNTIGAVATWTTGSVTVPVLVADQYKHKLVSIGNITPPVNAGPSTMLLFKTTRAGTDPLDTYSTNKTGGTPAANVGILYLDLHYQKVRAGTQTPGSYD